MHRSRHPENLHLDATRHHRSNLHFLGALHQLQQRPSLLRHPHTLLGILHRRPVSDAARRHHDTPPTPKPPEPGRNHRHRHRRPSLRRQHRLPRIHRPAPSHWRSTIPTLRLNTTRHWHLLVGITETSTP